MKIEVACPYEGAIAFLLLNLGEGDSVFLTETADGIQITTSEPE